MNVVDGMGEVLGMGDVIVMGMFQIVQVNVAVMLL